MQLLLAAYYFRGLLSLNLSAALHAGKSLYDDLPRHLLAGQAMMPVSILQGASPTAGAGPGYQRSPKF